MSNDQFNGPQQTPMNPQGPQAPQWPAGQDQPQGSLFDAIQPSVSQNPYGNAQGSYPHGQYAQGQYGGSYGQAAQPPKKQSKVGVFLLALVVAAAAVFGTTYALEHLRPAKTAASTATSEAPAPAVTGTEPQEKATMPAYGTPFDYPEIDGWTRSVVDGQLVFDQDGFRVVPFHTSESWPKTKIEVRSTTGKDYTEISPTIVCGTSVEDRSAGPDDVKTAFCAVRGKGQDVHLLTGGSQHRTAGEALAITIDFAEQLDAALK